MIAQQLDDLTHKRLSRRAFLARSTALGLSAPLALHLAGTPAAADSAPATAETTSPAIQTGGTLRIQQTVRPLDDPRLYAWSEHGNLTRGFLEYLVEYQADGTFRGMLLERWEVSADAMHYRLFPRAGVRWNDGTPFTAQDVARNIHRWCDATLAGNSMAQRMFALIDPATGQARDGAITVSDAGTVDLTLAQPDIALIAGFSDYPAAVTDASYSGGNPFDHGIGTGPFRPVSHAPGQRCVLERDPAHEWWGSAVFGGPYLDRIEFIDLGTDPASWKTAAEAGEIDLLNESIGTFIEQMDAIGWTRSRTETAATIVARPRQDSEIDGIRPYRDAAIRRALAAAVDNAICLELGYAGRGQVAANHHVSPLHPAYADIGPAPYDPEAAAATLAEAGLADFEHELTTLDDEWQRNTGDAIAAQLADAGITVRRKILPSAAFSEGWLTHPFSLTQWNHRPLDVQALALAYRSGAAWNESGFADAEFDALLDQAMSLPDAASRRPVMRQLQQILRREGVIIQPYWRALYTHHRPGLVNAGKHPAHEIHFYKIGFAEGTELPVAPEAH